jgi:ribosomal protein L37AE/L43A
VRSSASNPHVFYVVCPLCESGELHAFARESARCRSCGCLLGGETLKTLLEIVRLPEALGDHACECGHPEMRRLPGEIFHCPACGSEVVPVEGTTASRKPAKGNDAYCCA